MRRRMRITSVSSGIAAIPRFAFARMSAKQRLGSRSSSVRSRCGEARTRSQRWGEPTARPASTPSSIELLAQRPASVCPAGTSAISASQFARRVRASTSVYRHGAAASRRTSEWSDKPCTEFMSLGSDFAVRSRAAQGVAVGARPVGARCRRSEQLKATVRSAVVALS